jgi:hypothetical protein
MRHGVTWFIFKLKQISIKDASDGATHPWFVRGSTLLDDSHGGCGVLISVGKWVVYRILSNRLEDVHRGPGSGRESGLQVDFPVFSLAPGDGETTWEVPFARESATPSALGGRPLPCHGGWALNHPCVPPWERRGRREGGRRCRRENQPRRRRP